MDGIAGRGKLAEMAVSWQRRGDRCTRKKKVLSKSHQLREEEGVEEILVVGARKTGNERGQRSRIKQPIKYMLAGISSEKDSA